MSTVGQKRKRNSQPAATAQPPAKKRKKSMPNGYCAASISKCKLHRQYLCSDCHQVTATGLLKKTPEYLPETQKACTWNGHPKKSIPKHSKRYHGTQSKHAQYWRACIESSQSTIQKQQNSQNSIHLDQKSHSSRDGRVHNDHNHNNSSCATIRNVVSNDVIDISNEQAQDILSYTPTHFVSTLDEEVTLLHVSPKRKKKQTTLNEYQFTDVPPNTLDLCVSQQNHLNLKTFISIRENGVPCVK
eukprot:969994_1